MSTFLAEYEKQFSEPIGIPNFEMNRPYCPDGPTGDVGLELEVEGEGLPSQGSLEKIVGGTSKARWDAKTDGSLRGEALEYVLSTPCMIDEVGPLVAGLYAKFSTMGTRLQLTNRCSTHVHVNMVGKKINEITSAIALWTAFEEPLTLWAGEERVNNHFCLTAKDSNNGTVQAWRTFLRSGRRDFRDNLKYSSLNILTLHRFGSIEYRVMNASENPDRIIDWTKFVFTLTRYAGEQFNNPRSLLYSMSERGGRDLFRDICERAGVTPAFVLGVESTVSDLDRVVLEGFRRAQPLVAGPDWDAWMPEIQKEYVVNPFGSKTKKKATYRDIVDLDWVGMHEARPAPYLRVDPFLNRLAQPAAPRPEPAQERPEGVPENFVQRRMSREWWHPDYDNIIASLSHVVHTAPIPTTFEGLRSAPVDWSRPIEFADGSPAILLKVDPRHRVAMVSSPINIIASRRNLCGQYMYDTDTGRWSGGDDTYPLVRNIQI